MDTVADQKAFSDKFRLTFPLLADIDGKICDTFKVVHPDNKPSRETFLFRDGKLVHHFPKVDAANQAQELIEKIAELSR